MVNEYAHDASSAGLPGEIAARIADFLVRKTKEVPARVDALCDVIEKKVVNDGVRDGLLALVRKFKIDFRRRKGAEGSMTESDWHVLVERIECYGRTSTIENYSEYLFTFESSRIESI